MLTRLDGVLLCGEAEGVVPHRMQHIEALQALVTGEDIAGDVSQRVSYVQARAAGVREHIQHIVFGFGRIHFGLVGFPLSPLGLPLSFNFCEVIIHIII